ncbi:hypothetical protein BH10ACI2_BH10ACI2_09230 [soil metagenome]
METKSQLVKASAKKGVSKKKLIEADPFAAVATEAPAKKRVSKKSATPVKVKSTVAKAKAEPVAKTISKSANTKASDPFSEAVHAVSPVKKRSVKAAAPAADKAQKEITKSKPNLPKVALSPTFMALADVSLPKLKRENRARLQMQSPTRLYFYWSVKENPWQTLRRVFGDDMGSYSLVLKLIDKKTGFEKLEQTEVEGNYWFDAEPDRSYEAEIGFYAPNRPYFRILHSNTVETPRRSPSPRAATDADWKVSANKFAEVLDVAGFSRDAFDVVMAGDDPAVAENASQNAFNSFLGTSVDGLDDISAEDIRYAMLALASGTKLEDLRFRVSASLFAILQANAGQIEAAKAMSALTEYFDLDETEFTEEEFGPAVYGASLVNFPRTLKTHTVSNRGTAPKGPAESSSRYNPVSSHSFR